MTEFNEVKKLFPFISSQNVIIPKSVLEPGEYGLILKRGDQLEQSNLFAPTLVSARWGLVPNEFCSTNDADKFGLHQIRFERLKYSRPLTNIYPARRCLIPVWGLELDGVDALEPGTPRLLAGIWTQFLRPMMRIQSFGLLTRQRRGKREAVVLEPDRAERWLNPNSGGKELRAIAEGWWESGLYIPSPTEFTQGTYPTLEPQAEPVRLESRVEATFEVKPIEFKTKFSPGDQVRNLAKKTGEVLEVQAQQQHGVLVRYQDGLELWHSFRELHHNRTVNGSRL